MVLCIRNHYHSSETCPETWIMGLKGESRKNEDQVVETWTEQESRGRKWKKTKRKNQKGNTLYLQHPQALVLQSQHWSAPQRHTDRQKVAGNRILETTYSVSEERTRDLSVVKLMVKTIQI